MVVPRYGNLPSGVDECGKMKEQIQEKYLTCTIEEVHDLWSMGMKSPWRNGINPASEACYGHPIPSMSSVSLNDMKNSVPVAIAFDASVIVADLLRNTVPEYREDYIPYVVRANAKNSLSLMLRDAAISSEARESAVEMALALNRVDLIQVFVSMGELGRIDTRRYYEAIRTARCVASAGSLGLGHI